MPFVSREGPTTETGVSEELQLENEERQPQNNDNICTILLLFEISKISIILKKRTKEISGF